MELGKKGQFNFVWLFALIVGGVILYLAVYGALKAGETSDFEIDSEIAKKISILVDPLQAGFAESSYGSITFKEESRINNFCIDSADDFGRNEISVSTRDRLSDEFKNLGASTSVYNKYIFSSGNNQAKKYYVFSKTFEFPYKVSDMIFLIPENYCFYNSPEEVKDEIGRLGIPNIEIVGGSEDCSFQEDAINVCFDGIGVNCDVEVFGTCNGCSSKFDEGKVEKNEVSSEYIRELMYAAIFSDKGIYDCNVQRLLYRTSRIAEVFSEKTDLMSARGCDSNLKPDLLIWNSYLQNSTVNNLHQLNSYSETLENKNEKENCGLW